MDMTKSIIRLNPNSFLFTDWDLYSYSLYIICEDIDVAREIQKLEMQDEKYERLFGRLRNQKKDESKNSNKFEAAAFEKEESMMPSKISGKKKNQDGSMKDEEKSLLGHKAEGDSMYSTMNKKRTTKGKAKVTEEPAALGKDVNVDMFKDYERLPKPQTQMEVSEDHLLSKLKNHVVVCGIHSSIMHFILPLRAKYLESKQQDIVIITPIQTIPSEIWDSISRFPRIFLINGSPLMVEVLRKAQIHKADKAVILGHDPTTTTSHELTDEMLDA